MAGQITSLKHPHVCAIHVVETGSVQIRGRRVPYDGEQGGRMITIPVRGRVQPDGTLVVSVATGMPESEAEVLAVVNPLSSGAPADQSRTWPAGFFERTYGACASEPL